MLQRTLRVGRFVIKICRKRALSQKNQGGFVFITNPKSLIRFTFYYKTRLDQGRSSAAAPLQLVVIVRGGLRHASPLP